jgi:hypothetical protein
MPDSVAELQSAGAWQLFQDMLRDMTTVVTEDAESEREFVEGLRVIARISSLCAQLSVETDPDQPSFFVCVSQAAMYSSWPLRPCRGPR